MTAPDNFTHCQPASPDDPKALRISYTEKPFIVDWRRIYYHWWCGQLMQEFIWEYFRKTAPETEEEKRQRLRELQ